MDCSPTDSSVHGISQARILEWVAISFPRGSSQSRDGTLSLGFPGLEVDSLQLSHQGSPRAGRGLLNDQCQVPIPTPSWISLRMEPGNLCILNLLVSECNWGSQHLQRTWFLNSGTRNWALNKPFKWFRCTILLENYCWKPPNLQMLQVRTQAGLRTSVIDHYSLIFSNPKHLSRRATWYTEKEKCGWTEVPLVGFIYH